MQDQYDDFKSAGGELVVISAEKNELSKDLADKQKLTFPIVFDEGLNISRAFGLAFDLPAEIREIYQSFGIDIPKNTGRDVWELPMPARFVVDTDGIIRAASVDPDYTKRPEPTETAAVLKSLA